MKLTRTEIIPGVFLNHLKAEKFKTACLSVSLLTQLDRENAFANALIPFVLRRGTLHYPDMEALSNKLDDLYGSAVEPVVRRIGEIQCIGMYSSFPENDYLPDGENVLEGVINLIAEMLLSPATRGGLLIPAYVEGEKENLADIIRSRINDKRSYSIARCGEEMCAFEDYSAGKFGKEDDAEYVNYKNLTKRYHKLISESPVEIFYCGKADNREICSYLKDAFAIMPRGEINYDIGTDIRMNSVEEKPRYYEENLDVNQGKLVLGFRLGECMEDLDIAAVNVFNVVFGSGVTSKLFMNVREKLSLCYYASSMLDKAKGLMYVASGIDFNNFDAAKDEILRQLDDVKNGVISDEELEYAKRGIMSDLSALEDSVHDIESFYFSQTVQGLEYTPSEMSYLINEVTKDQVSAIAKSTVLDLVYFLRDCEEDSCDE